jgi:hypothetical protein
MLAGNPGPELLAFSQLVAGKPAAVAKVAIPGIPLLIEVRVGGGSAPHAVSLLLHAVPLIVPAAMLSMTKQVLMLSTGVIALTFTFLDGKLATYSNGTRHVLEAGWLGYLISIMCGGIDSARSAGEAIWIAPNRQMSVLFG